MAWFSWTRLRPGVVSAAANVNDVLKRAAAAINYVTNRQIAPDAAISLAKMDATTGVVGLHIGYTDPDFCYYGFVISPSASSVVTREAHVTVEGEGNHGYTLKDLGVWRALGLRIGGGSSDPAEEADAITIDLYANGVLLETNVVHAGDANPTIFAVGGHVFTGETSIQLKETHSLQVWESSPGTLPTQQFRSVAVWCSIIGAHVRYTT